MFFCLSHFNPRKLNHLHDASFEKKLGEGAFGRVKIYRCKENCNGKLCEECFVVKTIKIFSLKKKIKYIFQSPNYLTLINQKLKLILFNEWDIGKNLDHHNIIKTLDIDSNRKCLIFEYFESIDLYKYVTTNIFEYPLKIKNQYSIDIFKQILNGIKYLHDNNVVHLDLKLENIIINSHTRIIKIIDFGKAIKINDSPVIARNKCEWGTLQYIPPEYFNRDETIDLIKIDVWACGILLYNLIYRSTPWNIACKIRDTRYDCFQKHLKFNILSKIIFPNLDNRGWSIQNMNLINTLFCNFYKEDYNSRITIKQVIEQLDLITTD